MDEFFVKFLLLDETTLVGIAFLLIIVGGVVAAYCLQVKISFRRVTYLWFLAGINLAVVIAQIGWVLVPAAADAGILWVLVLGMLGFSTLFGVVLYFGSAARSNDIAGDTKSAWMGFVPFVNFWLIFKRGDFTTQNAAAKRSALSRYVGDPLLILGALAVLAMAQGFNKAIEDVPVYQVNDSAALTGLVNRSQTLEESFAAEAFASSKDLPIRVDEITIFESISAFDDTLTMTFKVERDISGLRPGFEQTLASQACAPEMFAHDLARGGRIIYIYNGPDGHRIGRFEITQQDCLQI